VLSNRERPNNDVVVNFVPLNTDSQKIRYWLAHDDAQGTRRDALRKWLNNRGEEDLAITSWIYSGKTNEYTEAIKDLNID
jgi:hypothetical protein